jgi:hypothetical protein
MSEKTLRMLHQRLVPLAIGKMPLAVAPPRKSRFGGTLSLSKVHWVAPKLVAEVTYLMDGRRLVASYRVRCPKMLRRRPADRQFATCESVVTDFMVAIGYGADAVNGTTFLANVGPR